MDIYGYYGKSIVKNQMGISRSEVNMVNNGRNNCAKCNAEMEGNKPKIEEAREIIRNTTKKTQNRRKR